MPRNADVPTIYIYVFKYGMCATQIKKLSEIKVVIFGKIEVLILWNMVNLETLLFHSIVPLFIFVRFCQNLLTVKRSWGPVCMGPS